MHEFCELKTTPTVPLLFSIYYLIFLKSETANSRQKLDLCFVRFDCQAVIWLTD